jgi:hypothetical protein
MTDLITTTNANDLIVAINNEHEAILDGFTKMVTHAIRCGELLIEAKAIIPYGEWEDWVGDNCKFAMTTARGYMRLAELSSEERQRVAGLSLRDALEAIRKVKAGPPEEDPDKTIEGEAVETGDTDVEPVRVAGDDEADDGIVGRSPEQKADDIATSLINDALTQSQWKQVDHLLVLQTLIRKLTEQLKTVIPLSAEESAEAMNAVAETEEAPPPKKKSKQKEASADEQNCAHPGCENKFKDKRAKFCPEHRKAKATEPPPAPAAGNGVDNDASKEERGAYYVEEATA